MWRKRVVLIVSILRKEVQKEFAWYDSRALTMGSISGAVQ